MSASRSGRPALAVAGLSAGVFLLEVLLTRVFSVTLFHHFAFAAISMGMLGLAAAGVRVALAPGRFTIERAEHDVTRAAGLFCATTLAAVLIVVRVGVFPSFSWGAVARIVLIYAVCVVPFYFAGLGLSLIFTHGREIFARLYAFDLVAAGLAGLGVFPLLRGLGGPAAAIAAGIIATLAVLVAYPEVRPSLRQWVLGAALTGALVLAFDAPFGLLRLRDPKGQGPPRAILFEAWNALSRVAVYDQRLGPWSLAPNYRGPIAAGLLMDIDAAAGTSIVPAGADNDYLRYELTAVAQVVAPRGRALVIGAGGGRDVLAAVLSGFAPVDAVEINPIIANDVMRGRFRAASGGLYDDPRVVVHVGDGRSFVRGSPDRYSLIQLSMVDTWAATAAGAFALSENNLYTLEATQEYLRHLGPGGVLTLTRWAGGEVLRLVILVEAAARSLGVADPSRHLAVIQHRDAPGVANIAVSLVYRAEPFDEAAATALRAHVEACGFFWLHDPLRWVPGRVSEVARADSPLIEAQRTEDYELAASTDDRPFFFYRPRPFVAGLLENPTRLFVEGQYLVSVVLLLSTLLGAAAILLPLWRVGREALRAEAGTALRCVPYFAALGLGFMFVEVSLMQRFVLYLGHPTHALTAVLAGLLVGAGLGSALAGRSLVGVSAARAASLVLGVLVLFALTRGLAFDATQAVPFAVKVLFTEALVVPLGLALGTLMPLGIARLVGEAPSLVPWAWGVNGFASVVGATAAALCSMTWGFSVTFAVGGLCYAAAVASAFADRGSGAAGAPRPMV